MTHLAEIRLRDTLIVIKQPNLLTTLEFVHKIMKQFSIMFIVYSFDTWMHTDKRGFTWVKIRWTCLSLVKSGY